MPPEFDPTLHGFTEADWNRPSLINIVATANQ